MVFAYVDDGVSFAFDDPYIWLPFQDQLQKMMGCDYNDWLPDFLGFVFDFHEGRFLFEDYPKQFTSMEQLWLAFVMKEKYGKVWDGATWTLVQ